MEFALSIVLALGSLTGPVAGPQIIGERANDLTSADIADIRVLGAEYGPVWLLDVEETYFLKPPNLQGLAYLAPESRSATLRRGRFIRVYQEKSATPLGYEWRVSGRPMNWVQVASPGLEFGTALTPPGVLDRPFRVEGDIPDADLLSLVSFIRGSPSKPGRTTEESDGSRSLEVGEQADGTKAIINIEMKADCFFEVTTESRYGSGESIEVSRTENGWRVVSVAMWVT